MTDYLRDFKPDVFLCSICEEIFDEEYHRRHEYQDEPVCEYCLKDYFIVCDGCGEIVEKDAELEICPECGDVLEITKESS